MGLTEATTEQMKNINGSVQITNCRWEKQPSAKEILQKNSEINKDSAHPTFSQFTDLHMSCYSTAKTAISWIGNFVHVRGWKGEEGVPPQFLCFIPAKPHKHLMLTPKSCRPKGNPFPGLTFRTTIASWLRHCTKNFMARVGRILSSLRSRDRKPMPMCSNFQGLEKDQMFKTECKYQTLCTGFTQKLYVSRLCKYINK